MIRRVVSTMVLVLVCMWPTLPVHSSVAETVVRAAGVSSGYVAAWGDNFYGQLGTQSCCSSRTRPAPITGLTDVVSIAADWRHAVAARLDGSVYEWGRCCGPSVRHQPVQILELVSIASVAAGENFDLALEKDGTVWAWGNNTYGQLGPGAQTAGHSGCSVSAVCSLPLRVAGIDHVVQVAATFSVSLALRNDGTVWSWGSMGGYSSESEEGHRMAAVHRIGALSNVTAIAVGDWLAAALTADGHVWVWQFLAPTVTNPEGRSKPVEIPGLDHAKGMATNGRSVAIIREDGSVSTWDTRAPDVIDIRLGPETSVPVLHDVRAISGREPFLALEADGSVWTWASLSAGSASPIRVPGITDALSVTAGEYSGYAIVRTAVLDTPPPSDAQCLPALVPGQIPPSRTGADAARPISMAIDEFASRVYVLNAPRPLPQDQPVPWGASVTTLDLKTRKVIRTVLVGPMLDRAIHAFAVAERAGRVFVASPGTRGNDNRASVTMLDAESGKIIKTIPVAGGAGALVLGKSTGPVFVLGGLHPGSRTATVTVLATSDGRAVATTDLEAFDRGAAVVDDRRHTVYISEFNRIYILDERTGQKTGEIDSMPCVGSLAIDRSANRLFTASTGAREVSGYLCAIDLTSNTIVQTVDEGMFASAQVVAVDEAAGVVLTLEGGGAFSTATTYSIRRSTTGLKLPQPGALKAQRNIAPVLVDYGTGRMFLSDRPDGLRVLDPHTWKIVGTIPLGPRDMMAIAGSQRLIVGVSHNDVISTVSMDRVQR